jgi:hypothetical protein
MAEHQERVFARLHEEGPLESAFAEEILVVDFPGGLAFDVSVSGDVPVMNGAEAREPAVGLDRILENRPAVVRPRGGD